MRPLRAAVTRALLQEGYPSCEVCLLLTDDEEVRELNRDYRGQDKPTDVLSFGQLDSAGSHPAGTDGPPLCLGDIVISVETARRQAPTYERTFQQEMELLAVHGALHLVGYDDETDDDAEAMRLRETVALTLPGRDHCSVRAK